MAAPRGQLDEYAKPKGPDRLDATRFEPANRRRLSGPGLCAASSPSPICGG
jgi:hypothetical protein